MNDLEAQIQDLNRKKSQINVLSSWKKKLDTSFKKIEKDAIEEIKLKVETYIDSLILALESGGIVVLEESGDTFSQDEVQALKGIAKRVLNPHTPKKPPTTTNESGFDSPPELQKEGKDPFGGDPIKFAMYYRNLEGKTIEGNTPFGKIKGVVKGMMHPHIIITDPLGKDYRIKPSDMRVVD